MKAPEHFAGCRGRAGRARPDSLCPGRRLPSAGARGGTGPNPSPAPRPAPAPRSPPGAYPPRAPAPAPPAAPSLRAAAPPPRPATAPGLAPPSWLRQSQSGRRERGPKEGRTDSGPTPGLQDLASAAKRRQHRCRCRHERGSRERAAPPPEDAPPRQTEDAWCFRAL
jgi:hypothetical protein